MGNQHLSKIIYQVFNDVPTNKSILKVILRKGVSIYDLALCFFFFSSMLIMKISNRALKQWKKVYRISLMLGLRNLSRWVVLWLWNWPRIVSSSPKWLIQPFRWNLKSRNPAKKNAYPAAIPPPLRIGLFSKYFFFYFLFFLFYTKENIARIFIRTKLNSNRHLSERDLALILFSAIDHNHLTSRLCKP